MAKTFQCTLITPQAQLLDEPVAYASIPAWDGLLGVQAQRAALVVKLGDGALRLDMEDGSSRRFFVGGGFAQMKDNRLSLLTEETVGADEIDHEEAQAALAEAQARQATGEEQVARRQREINRAKAMIQVASR